MSSPLPPPTGDFRNALPESGLPGLREAMIRALGGVRFGSPWAGDTRQHEEALERWLRDGCRGEPPRRRREDVLEPFRDAWIAQPKKMISIRMDEWLLALVKQMAVQVGMPYQEILRLWMEEGLRRAVEEGATATGSEPARST